MANDYEKLEIEYDVIIYVGAFSSEWSEKKRRKIHLEKTEHFSPFI